MLIFPADRTITLLQAKGCGGKDNHRTVCKPQENILSVIGKGAPVAISEVRACFAASISSAALRFKECHVIDEKWDIAPILRGIGLRPASFTGQILRPDGGLSSVRTF